MIRKSFNRSVLYGMLGVALLHSACAGISPRQLANLPGPGVEFQEKKVYRFKEQGVYFSNRFHGARLNNASVLNDSTFVIQIKPENSPINPSPWYAFQVWTDERDARNVHIVLDYGSDKHRYWPKWKTDTSEWAPLQDLSLNEANSQAHFTVRAGKDKVLVSGQPLFNKDSIDNWLHSLGRKPDVNLEKIGKSTLGETIWGFHTPETANKRAIAILGGQHPPEFTGFEGQMAFVNFILGDDPLAVEFRKHYQIVAVPWINPDGHNNGHWRHNVAGVDLNRDWGSFLQKETTAARDYFLSFDQQKEIDFVFGIDFHSTFRDVLYTNKLEEGHHTHIPGLMDDWVKKWNESLGDLAVKEEPSKPNGRVSKSWLLTELHADAVTYEVADTTPYPEIHHKARQAAIALINVLLEEIPNRN